MDAHRNLGMALGIGMGLGLSEMQKANDRLKKMETMVAVCGDVAAYFAPNDELTAGAELSTPPRKAKVAKQ